MSIRQIKYNRDIDSRARLRYNIIKERYFIKGMHLENIAKDIGMSLSGAEKIASKISKELNSTKRELQGEALDDPLIAYRKQKRTQEIVEIKLFYTMKQAVRDGFKQPNVYHSLHHQTCTYRERSNWYFCLAKDFDASECADVKMRREIRQIKMKNICK